MKKYLIIILLSFFVTLNVVSKNNVDETKKVVALTFDDGPSRYTNAILDILEKYNVKATFFVIGNKANIYPKTLNRIIDMNSEIGNHSYNHKWLSRLNDTEFLNEINKTNEIIKNITNKDLKLLRPTYGAITRKQRKLTNLEIVFWDVDTLDWKIKKVSTIVNRVLTKVSDKDIILMHDTYERTVAALDIIIPKLLEQNYQFVTVSELNNIKKLEKNLDEYL